MNKAIKYLVCFAVLLAIVFPAASASPVYACVQNSDTSEYCPNDYWKSNFWSTYDGCASATDSVNGLACSQYSCGCQLISGGTGDSSTGDSSIGTSDYNSGSDTSYAYGSPPVSVDIDDLSYSHDGAEVIIVEAKVEEALTFSDIMSGVAGYATFEASSISEGADINAVIALIVSGGETVSGGDEYIAVTPTLSSGEAIFEGVSEGDIVEITGTYDHGIEDFREYSLKGGISASEIEVLEEASSNWWIWLLIGGGGLLLLIGVVVVIIVVARRGKSKSSGGKPKSKKRQAATVSEKKPKKSKKKKPAKKTSAKSQKSKSSKKSKKKPKQL